MHNSNIPQQTELPSTGRLIRSTLLAAAAGGVILVTVIMPAEYGIDPTGAGGVLGLTKMGEIKVSLAQEVAADRAASLAQTPASPEPVVPSAVLAETAPVETVPVETVPAEPEVTVLSHERTFTLASNEGTEIKLEMSKGAKANYVWSSDGGPVNYDIHADSVALKIDYHNYAKGSVQRDEGVIEAEFEGYHGWFWRNRTAETLTITLQTNGDYLSIKP
ncbi:MAG: transmembrane anchor protein [Henriciella sp.]|nr:transmembrane anchor protein [Henriciella sp.]